MTTDDLLIKSPFTGSVGSKLIAGNPAGSLSVTQLIFAVSSCAFTAFITMLESANFNI
jgi:hypothetical protein